MWLTSGLRQRRPMFMDEEEGESCTHDMVCIPSHLANIHAEQEDTVEEDKLIDIHV